VTDKKNRWIVSVVLICAVIGFVGFSIVPIFSNAFKGDQKPIGGTSTTPGAVASASPEVVKASQKEPPLPQPEELRAQVKGYEAILQQEPENQAALKGLVKTRLTLINMKQGEIKDVIGPLEKLAKLNPTEPRYTILLAQSKQFTGDREGAAQLYRTLLTSQPGNLDALEGLTDLLIQQERPAAAIGLLQDTLKTANQANQIQAGSVDVISVQILLGKVYALEKQYDDAIEVYDTAIKGNKQDFRPVLAKALVLREQGKPEAAKPLFATAVGLAPAQFKDQVRQLETGDAIPSAAPKPEATPGATPSPSATPKN